jgi:hypothetical protein
LLSYSLKSFPDAVGDVADQDLGPGVVLGGGGGEDVVEEVSIAGASSGGDDFVQDAVGDVADQDLEPGVVLGGGGGEDVVEEVWWQTWRRRKGFFPVIKLAQLPHVASHCGYASGGDDFVSDAVGGVADRDLGPGIVLGGGGGEDVVEEVWWRTWRQRKRWRKGRQNAKVKLWHQFLARDNTSDTFKMW